MMRIRDRRKRWDRIVAYCDRHPELTQEEIGKHFKLTQVTISKVLKRFKDNQYVNTSINK